MKNQLSIILVVALTLIFSACKKEEPTPTNNNTNNNNNNNPNPNPTSTYHFKVKIDGNQINGSFTSGAKDSTGMANMASIITFKSQVSAFAFVVLDYSGAKTYSGENTMLALASQSGTFNYHTMPTDPATIKITEDNGTEVKGEFSGKLYNEMDSTDNISLTEGSFYFKWTK